MKHWQKIVIVAAIVAAAATALAFKTLTGVTQMAVGCGTTATAITTGDGYNSILCSNINSTEVYFGGSTVATTTGVPICDDTDLCAGSSISIDTNQGQLYCRTASGTVEIRCIVGK